MDSEEIQNRIVNLGKNKFRDLVAFLLSKLFGFKMANVDAAGDGGSDWILFTSGGEKVRTAIQDTIQQQDWEAKALEDAHKALKSGANRFFFCTNRAHQQIKIKPLESKITSETGLSATVLDGRQMAELIFQGDLIDEFLEAIGEKVSGKRPAMPEIALCAYTNLSADRSSHRNEIYSDTLLMVCRDGQPMTREALVEGAMGFLGSGLGQRQLIDRRVDILLSEKKLVKDKETQTFKLSAATARQIDQIERLYLSDWNSLTGAQTTLLNEYGGNWNEAQAEQATILIARLFIQEQLTGLKSAGAELLQGSWLQIGIDARQQLRDLMHKCGIGLKQIPEVIGKLVELARNREVIAKVTRTAVFAALEGQDPLQSARALGAVGWEDVNVLLDASVAIPLLCARLTETVDNYRYALSSDAVDTLQALRAETFISPGHLQECASHLLNAFHYDPIDTDGDFAEALRQSENVFIAYYYALRAEKRKCPASLQEFLNIFSKEAPSLANRPGDWSDRVRRIMPDLQLEFSEYDVFVTQLSRLDRERFGNLEKAQDFALHDQKRDKPSVLRKHDVAALAHIESRAIENNEAWMFLTWDKLLIKLAASQIRKGWVVSPEVAIDFAQPCRLLSETQWCTLAHRLARVSNPREELTARILDTVARFQHEKLQDWEFKQQIRAFRDEAMSRLPVGEDALFHEWVEKELLSFLATHDIKPPPPESGDVAPAKNQD